MAEVTDKIILDMYKELAELAREDYKTWDPTKAKPLHEKMESVRERIYERRKILWTKQWSLSPDRKES